MPLFAPQLIRPTPTYAPFEFPSSCFGSRIRRFRGIKNLRLIDFLWDNSQSWMSTESQRTILSRSEPSHIAANSDILMWEGRSSWFDRLLLSAVRESWVQVPYIHT